MSDKTDDLIISVSTDVSTIKRQLRQLSQDIGQTTSGIQKQFDGLGKGIDQSLTPVQKRINDMVGIASTASKPLKEWKGALAGVGAETQNLTKSFALNRAGLMELRAAGVNSFQALASGMSAARVAEMEGAQVLGAFIQGTEGGLVGLGKAAIGLATRFPLVTAAIGAAGLAIVAYEASGIGSFKSLDEIIKTHEANIKRLGDAYDEVNGKRQNYASDTARTVNQLNKQGAQDAADLLKKQTLDLLGKMDANLAFFDDKGRFAAFAAPIKELMDEMKNGTPDIKAFRDQINAIADANPELDGKRKEILDFSQSAADTAAQLPNLYRAVSDVNDIVNEFKLQLANVDSKPIQKELQDLFDKAREGKEPIDGILQSLAALEQANPNFSGILAGFKSILIAASQAEAALDNLGSKYFSNQGTNPNGRQKLPAGVLPDSVDIVPEHANKEDLGAAYDKAVAKANRRSSRGVPKTADDRFAEDLQAIKDRTTALQQEAAMIGLSDEEQTKRSTALDLEQKALKQVREEARKKGDQDWQNKQLSPEQIAAIDAQSEAYARQKQALKDLQEMYDLQKDITKGVFDDLRSALDDGKLDWQDFAKIAEDALNKIIDKIENDLVDAIMQASYAGGGNGGWLGSLLGIATGGGGGSSGPFPGGGTLNSLGGLYDSGGYTGAGGKKQIAGLVHKGEVVFSQDDIARNGGVAAVEAMRRGRAISAPQMPSIQVPARGGDTQAVNINVRVDGATGNTEVMQMVQAGVQRGIGQFAKSPAFTRSTANSLKDIRVTSGGRF